MAVWPISAKPARTAARSPGEAAGEAGLDDVDAEPGAGRAGDLELLGRGQAGAGRLLAVAEGGVEDSDESGAEVFMEGRVLGWSAAKTVTVGGTEQAGAEAGQLLPTKSQSQRPRRRRTATLVRDHMEHSGFPVTSR